MKIIGVDRLVWGVDNLATASEFCRDVGLAQGSADYGRTLFSALDGTGIELCDKNDPNFPAELSSKASLRQIIWGVDNH